MGLPIIPIAVELVRKLGPTLLRKFGKAKGGTTAEVADAVANVVEGVQDAPEDQQQAAIAEAIKGLPPEQAAAFLELQVELERVQQEGVWRELDVQKEQIKSDAAARVAELAQSDIYTKRTRPMIARQSWYVAAIYALACHVLVPLFVYYNQVEEATKTLPLVTFSWEVFLALSSPALTYMGVRGFEKWKHGNRIQ